MSEEIFRKKSLEKINSPENLHDYVRVSGLGMWLLLIGIVALLVGALIWGTVAELESSISVQAIVESGTATCTVADETVEAGMTLRIGDAEFTIDSVEADPGTGRLICVCTASLPDGTYDARIVTGSVRPISFVLN